MGHSCIPKSSTAMVNSTVFLSSNRASSVRPLHVVPVIDALSRLPVMHLPQPRGPQPSNGLFEPSNENSLVASYEQHFFETIKENYWRPRAYNGSHKRLWESLECRCHRSFKHQGTFRINLSLWYPDMKLCLPLSLIEMMYKFSNEFVLESDLRLRRSSRKRTRLIFERHEAEIWRNHKQETYLN